MRRVWTSRLVLTVEDGSGTSCSLPVPDRRAAWGAGEGGPKGPTYGNGPYVTSAAGNGQSGTADTFSSTGLAAPVALGRWIRSPSEETEHAPVWLLDTGIV